MLEFLGDNIFVVFAGKVFQQTVGIPIGTNCAPSSRRHLSVFIRSRFHKSLLSTGKKQLASRFNLTYRYIDDVLSINNPEFEDYLGQMYPAELEIKDITDSTTSASYLDLLLSIGRDAQLHTSIYDKRDDFNFHITKVPFLSSNIPSSPAYGELSLNVYDTPGLAPRMNVSFWGLGDFPVSYPNRDTSSNAWNRHSGSVMVDIGILFNKIIWSLPLTNVEWYSDPWPTVTSQLIRLSTDFMTWYRVWPSPNYEWFPWSICNGYGMPAGNAYPSGHLVPSPFLGLACAPIFETRFLELAMSLLDFSQWISLGTFSIYHPNEQNAEQPARVIMRHD